MNLKINSSGTISGWNGPTSSDTVQLSTCRWCGCSHDGMCPRVKTIEYYRNGSVKRVEFHEPTMEREYVPSVLQPPREWGQPPYEITSGSIGVTTDREYTIWYGGSQ